MNKSILIIDDDQDFSQLLKGIFDQAGYSVQTSISADQAFTEIKSHSFDLVVSDHRLPGGITGTEFLCKLRENNIDLPVIVVSGFLNDEAIRELIRDGVAGIFIKPLNIFSLMKKAASVIEARSKQLVSGEGASASASQDQPLGGIAGASAEGKAFLQRARAAAAFKRNLLLIGPPGTPFERIARDMVAHAPEPQRSSIVSPGNITAERLESLLNGDARSTALTLILLDAERLSPQEIETVIEAGDTYGGAESPLRMIFCLSQSVEELYDSEVIDEDFYLFLGTNELRVPPLRKMPEDLLVMARHELLQHNKDAVFDMKLRTLLLSHDWPDNFVELQAVIVRAVSLAQPMPPQGRHFEAALRSDRSAADAQIRSTFERFLMLERARYEQASARLLKTLS